MSYETIAIWSRIIGTLVVLGILWYVFARFIAPAIAQAQEAKNAEIGRAEQRCKDAKAEIAAAQAEIAQAETDAGAIRARAQADAKRERDAATAQAQEAGERLLRNADGELERARMTARDALRVQMIEQALELARGEAGQRVDSTRNAELVDKFVGSLESGGGHG